MVENSLKVCSLSILMAEKENEDKNSPHSVLLESKNTACSSFIFRFVFKILWLILKIMQMWIYTWVLQLWEGAVLNSQDA